MHEMMVRIALLPVATFLLLTSGCQSVQWMHTASTGKVEATGNAPSSLASREGSGLAPPSVMQVGATTGLDPVLGSENAANLGTSVERDEAILAELQVISSVDPVAAQQLIARLQDVKPSLRPLVAQQFRTSWQYHRELAAANGSTMLAAQGETQSVAHVASVPVTYQSPPPVATPTPGAPVAAPPEESRQAEVAPSPPAPSSGVPQANNVEVPAPDVLAANYESSPKLMPVVEPGIVGTSMEVEMPRDWQDALGQTIEQLTASSPHDPRNTDEAYQHVRLRLLHLIAGNRGQALEPIPGLTPTEQTYWSNQLFAIATLLEHEEQPDEERRASLAAAQLAEASAKLGELSTLSIRSLVFCNKVFGYGDYEKLELEAFKPGQSVTLYAEIDNFRSESTEKGYHTSLATSYEVLDQAGNRVEGGEFANVDDHCLNKRKDFYIEYTFQLPKRIYASKYQLRLLIRDRLSGKIGKSGIEFEIAQ